MRADHCGTARGWLCGEGWLPRVADARAALVDGRAVRTAARPRRGPSRGRFTDWLDVVEDSATPYPVPDRDLCISAVNEAYR